MENNIIRLVQLLKSKIENDDINAIQELYSNEGMLSSSLGDKKDVDYIRKMIFAQFNITQLLLDHGYFELPLEKKYILHNHSQRIQDSIAKDN